MESQKLDLAPINEPPRLDRIDSRRRKIDWQYWPDTSTQAKYTDDSAAHASVLSRPDIEDEALISWGLAQSQIAKDVETTVDVLYGEGIDLRKRLATIRMVLLD